MPSFGFRTSLGIVLGGMMVVSPSAADSPLPPKQAQQSFVIAPGFRIELIAAEPDIQSPVEGVFDEHGRLWVVEMRDYPNGPEPGQPPQGQIKILSDRDEDGFYEEVQLFADRLLFANGILPWKDGVIVTAAPHILFLRDTDGDGKADQRQVLFVGFAEDNPQLRVSHPILGLDGWVYVANGLRGGKVKSPSHPPDKAIDLAGMDFRFDPITGEGEAISGMGQYGNCFDRWENRFVCDNRHHLRHVVFPQYAAKRNPFLALPAVLEDISVLGAGPLNSGGKIYPISKNWTTSSQHVGRFTAACGVFVDQGSLLPGPYAGAAFTCDPTGNLVHAEVLRPNGATFRSRPVRDGIEFLATKDEWFRPVNLTQDPDGALVVVDMYRAVIEHPQFMPAELKNRPDLRLGHDRGRIWRIVPTDHPTKPSAKPKLAEMSTPELVKFLAHQTGWYRQTAHRLLLQREDRAAIDPLTKTASDSPSPQARLHAAALLDGINALTQDTLMGLFDDPHPRVVEYAVRLARTKIDKSGAVQKAVSQLADHPDGAVRFQVALTLGEWDSDEKIEPLVKLSRLSADDQWTRWAIASAIPNRAGMLLRELADGTKDRIALLSGLAELVGARRDPEEVGEVVQLIAGLGDQSAVASRQALLVGLAEGMNRRGTSLGAFLSKVPQKFQPAVEQVKALFAQAAQSALDSSQTDQVRLTAVKLLAHAPWETVSPVLARLIEERELAPSLRVEAIRALAHHRDPTVANLLLKHWRSYTPTLRDEVLRAILQRPERMALLLDELQAERVRPGDLTPQAIRRLVSSGSPDQRQRARKLLKDTVPADRAAVLKKYRQALSLPGDALRGREVFRANCANCHHVGGVGTRVGPDIADTRTKTEEMLLLDILNPNQAIDSNYINYSVTTFDGKLLTGFIEVETASSLTLKREEGETDRILKQDIDEIESTGVSLMPEGLEENITVEQMADLIRFLKDWRYLDGSIPLKED